MRAEILRQPRKVDSKELAIEAAALPDQVCVRGKIRGHRPKLFFVDHLIHLILLYQLTYRCSPNCFGRADIELLAAELEVDPLLRISPRE